MRFVHIADVHLGRRPDAKTRWEETAYREIYDGFERFVDYLAINPCDFLFITGDLFDHVPDNEELTYVDNLLAKLKDINIIYVTGDADYLRRNAPLWNFKFMSNIYLLNGEKFNNHSDGKVSRTMYADELVDCVYFEKYNLNIYGICQYSSHNERNDMDTLYVRDDRRINILLGHGGDERVCPFDTDDFASKTFNYVGMGHLHNYTENKKARVYYPGSLEPLDCNETGKHGFIKGYIDKFTTDVRFVPFADREYETVDVAVSDDMSDEELMDEISKLCRENKSHIYTINLIRGDDCYLDFSLDRLRKKYRILAVNGEKNNSVDADKLELLNRENVIGRTLGKIKNSDLPDAGRVAYAYADRITRIIWGEDNLGLAAQMVDDETAEAAQSKLKNDIKNELDRLSDGIELCDAEEKKLRDDKKKRDEIIGKLNQTRAMYGRLEYELTQIDYEDAQVNRIYGMKRIAFIERINLPFVIAVCFVATGGFIITFFSGYWDDWLNIIIALLCIIIALTIISFYTYNATKGIRKKLKGGELPVEKHARLANRRTELESKMHEIDVEINGYELDKDRLGDVDGELQKMEERRKKLLVRCRLYESMAYVCDIGEKKNLALILE